MFANHTGQPEPGNNCCSIAGNSKSTTAYFKTTATVDRIVTENTNAEDGGETEQSETNGNEVDVHTYAKGMTSVNCAFGSTVPQNRTIGFSIEFLVCCTRYRSRHEDP